MIRDDPWWSVLSGTGALRPLGRWQHVAHTDDQGPSRTGTAERRTNTAETRIIPDIHGPPRMLSSPRTVTQAHGSFELPKTAVLASRSPKDIPGPTGIAAELHGSYTVHTPDVIRVDPTPIQALDATT